MSSPVLLSFLTGAWRGAGKRYAAAVGGPTLWRGGGKDPPGPALLPAALTELSGGVGTQGQAVLETATHSPAPCAQRHAQPGSPTWPQASPGEPGPSRGPAGQRLGGGTRHAQAARLCPTDVKLGAKNEG